MTGIPPQPADRGVSGNNRDGNAYDVVGVLYGGFMIRGAATLSLFIWVSPFLVSAQPAPSSPSPPPVPNHDRIDSRFRIRNPGPFPLPPRYPIGKSAVAVDGLEDAIDRCMDDAMAAHSTPGASVAVAHDGQLMYQQGYGVKHRSEGGAVDPSTYFRVGSVTKQFTAAAILKSSL